MSIFPGPVSNAIISSIEDEDGIKVILDIPPMFISILDFSSWRKSKQSI